MKRLFSLLLTLCIILLCGCVRTDGGGTEAVYYYCRNEYAYGSRDGVIASEIRDISGHEGDMQYLLSMYLMGPLSEELECPFPSRTKMLSVRYGEDSIILEITDCQKLLSDSQFSLACACLAKTCLELSDARQVIINSGSQSMTLTSESFLLFDSPIPTETTALEDAQ